MIISKDQAYSDLLAERIDRYQNGAFNEIHGWVGQKIIHALHLTCILQDSMNIFGDSLEIGVFQGRFFLALMACMRDDELSVAADIFDNMTLNIDGSGAGENTYSKFISNVQNYADAPNAMKLVTSDSMVLRPDHLLSHSSKNGFRLISIDGGHTAEHVINDLSLSASVIVGGGVIFLDDFNSPHWPGVNEGYVKYMMNLNRNLAPILFVDNKLLMTTISMRHIFVDHFAKNFSTWQNQELRMVNSFGFDYIASA